MAAGGRNAISEIVKKKLNLISEDSPDRRDEILRSAAERRRPQDLGAGNKKGRDRDLKSFR
eukprot:9889038-Heterocapsa_arctica.AAC.1